MKKTQIVLLIFVLTRVAVASGNEYLGMEFHGFLSQGYLKSNHNNFLVDSEEGSFAFYDVGLNASRELDPKLRVAGQLLFRTMGKTNEQQLSVDWAFAEYRWRDWLGIRAGRIKSQHGLYSDVRDLDMIRPNVLLPQSVYDESDRETSLALNGAGVFGNIALEQWGDVSYEVAVGKYSIPDDGAMAQRVVRWGLLVDDIDVENTYKANTIWETPVSGVSLGVSRSLTNVIINGQQADDSFFPPPGALAGDPVIFHIQPLGMWVFSTSYMFGETVLATEYLRFDQETEMTIESSLNPAAPTMLEIDIDADGWYMSAAHRYNEWLHLSTYYSILWNDRHDRNNPDKHLKDACLTLRFDYGQNWNFKLEGHALNGTALLLESNNPQGLVSKWKLFAAKATFSF